MTPRHYRTKLIRCGVPPAKMTPRDAGILGGRPRREGVKRQPCGKINYYQKTGRPIGRPRKAL